MAEYWQSIKEFLPAWIAGIVAAVFLFVGYYSAGKDMAEIAGRTMKIPPREVLFALALLSFLVGAFIPFHRMRLDRDALRKQVYEQRHPIRFLCPLPDAIMGVTIAHGGLL